MTWFNTGIAFTHKPFIKKINVNRKNIAVVGYEGNVYALSARCPHAGEDLSRGWCAEGKVVCPVHRFSYSLETGRGSPGQNDYVNTYPAKIKDGIIYIKVEGLWERLKALFK